MPLGDDLKAQVELVFKNQWDERNGTVLPDDTSLTFTNNAVQLDATVLYADLSASTKLVDSKTWWFSAEVYKTFLYCSAKIINSEGGNITAYDGDQIMAVFLGDSKNSSAVRSALKINYCTKCIIQPAKSAQYTNDDYVLNHTVGIDSSTVRVVKTGVRGANDLVWIGRSANWAAKLCNLGPEYPTWITDDVYNNLNEGARISAKGEHMWEPMTWSKMANKRIYRSSYWWKI